RDDSQELFLGKAFFRGTCGTDGPGPLPVVRIGAHERDRSLGDSGSFKQPAPGFGTVRRRYLQIEEHEGRLAEFLENLERLLAVAGSEDVEPGRFPRVEER